MEAQAYKLINQMPVHQAKNSEREQEVGMIREDIADMKNLEKKHYELVGQQQEIFKDLQQIWLIKLQAQKEHEEWLKKQEKDKKDKK